MSLRYIKKHNELSRVVHTKELLCEGKYITWHIYSGYKKRKEKIIKAH